MKFLSPKIQFPGVFKLKSSTIDRPSLSRYLTRFIKSTVSAISPFSASGWCEHLSPKGSLVGSSSSLYFLSSVWPSQESSAEMFPLPPAFEMPGEVKKKRTEQEKTKPKGNILFSTPESGVNENSFDVEKVFFAFGCEQIYKQRQNGSKTWERVTCKKFQKREKISYFVPLLHSHGIQPQKLNRHRPPWRKSVYSAGCFYLCSCISGRERKTRSTFSSLSVVYSICRAGAEMKIDREIFVLLSARRCGDSVEIIVISHIYSQRLRRKVLIIIWRSERHYRPCHRVSIF